MGFFFPLDLTWNKPKPQSFFDLAASQHADALKQPEQYVRLKNILYPYINFNHVIKQNAATEICHIGY